MNKILNLVPRGAAPGVWPTVLPAGGPGEGGRLHGRGLWVPRALPVGKPAGLADAGAADRTPTLPVTSYRTWGTVVALSQRNSFRGHSLFQLGPSDPHAQSERKGHLKNPPLLEGKTLSVQTGRGVGPSLRSDSDSPVPV